jgi:uncharacterized protein YdhG (YjbR/CyaY superfamily)
MPAPSSVDEYLSGVPEEARLALEHLRETIRAAAPETTEVISYRMPTFKYRGRALVGFAAFENHCSVFPYSKSVMATLAEELRPVDIEAKGATIRFTTDAPLPDELVRRLVEARAAEIDALAAPS